MKKAKKICFNIITFVVTICVSVFPTLMFRTKEEINFLFRQPEYWIISVAIAMFVTWIAAQVINSKK